MNDRVNKWMSWLLLIFMTTGQVCMAGADQTCLGAGDHYVAGGCICGMPENSIYTKWYGSCVNGGTGSCDDSGTGLLTQQIVNRDCAGVGFWVEVGCWTGAGTCGALCLGVCAGTLGWGCLVCLGGAGAACTCATKACLCGGCVVTGYTNTYGGSGCP